MRHVAQGRAGQVAGQALEHVAPRPDEVARLVGKSDVALPPGGQRGGAAAGRAVFAAVAAVGAGEGDFGADEVEVVCGEVVAHAQAQRQPAHFVAVAQQVVGVDVAHAELAQHVQQQRVFALQGKDQLEAFIRIGQAQAHALAGQGAQHDELGALAQGGGQLVHVALGAALAVVQHGKDDGAWLALLGGREDAGHVHSHARGAGRVGLYEAQHIALVARVQAAQGLHGGALARAFGFAKAHAAKVAHEGVERVQVAPARLGGADAEVVFFAIAFAEVLFVKQARRWARPRPGRRWRGQRGRPAARCRSRRAARCLCKTAGSYKWWRCWKRA